MTTIIRACQVLKKFQNMFVKWMKIFFKNEIASWKNFVESVRAGKIHYNSIVYIQIVMNVFEV